MTPPLHVMQGRLLPPFEGRFQAFPADGWERELELAPAAGLAGVEWIYEAFHEERNPLGTREGRAAIRARCAEHGVAVESVCADWFLQRPLLHEAAAEREARLAWLVAQAAELGVRRIVVPFVDGSALRGAADGDALVAVLDRLMDVLERAEVELHLETDLGPEPFAALLARAEHPLVRANYDSGNSASLGHDMRDEWDAYGERVGSVHVKDRVRGGGTVPLGSGDADLAGLMTVLRERGWDRPLVLQASRGPDGQEVAKTRADAAAVRRLWEAAG